MISGRMENGREGVGRDLFVFCFVLLQSGFFIVYHMCSGSGVKEQQQKSWRQRILKNERKGRGFVVENADAKA